MRLKKMVPLLRIAGIRFFARFIALGLIIILLLLSLSYSPVAAETSNKLTVYVVNYPLKYFAGRIAGEHGNVVLPAPQGVDPAYWNPDIPTIGAYQQAGLILLNGAGYAKWVERVSLPRSKMVDTSAKFKERYITAEEVVTHSHGPGGEHAHENVAFTTWLDFDLAAKQAKEVADALIRKNPERKEVFQRNYDSLKKDLTDLDGEVQEIVAKNRNLPIIASHPVYQYFGKRYGVNLKSVHWEPDLLPTGEQWLELTRILKDHTAKWMIWEGKPKEETVEKFKSMGIGSVVVSPCANVPGEGDFLDVMRRNVKSLKLVFQEQK